MKKNIFLTILISFILILPLFILADTGSGAEGAHCFQQESYLMGGAMSNMMGGLEINPMGWLGFGWIFMILFWLFIFIAIILFVKWVFDQGKNKEKNNSALDILKERYAKGEISKQEFETKKKDLI